MMIKLAIELINYNICKKEEEGIKEEEEELKSPRQEGLPL